MLHDTTFMVEHDIFTDGRQEHAGKITLIWEALLVSGLTMHASDSKHMIKYSKILSLTLLKMPFPPPDT